MGDKCSGRFAITTIEGFNNKRLQLKNRLDSLHKRDFVAFFYVEQSSHFKKGRVIWNNSRSTRPISQSRADGPLCFYTYIFILPGSVPSLTLVDEPY